jgi:iron complex transport system permease protein
VILTRARAALVLGALTVALAAAATLALFLGRDLDGLRWLDPSVDQVVFSLVRAPRAVAAALAGAALAAAGVALQALVRNPLAEPYTLGVSTGAALGAVIAIRLGLEATVGSSAVAAAAFVGAAGAAGIVWHLARAAGGTSPQTLLLAGVTLAFVGSAATMLAQITASFAESYRIVRWMMGGLDGVAWSSLLFAGSAIAVATFVLILGARDLNPLAAGEEAASSVGVPVARAQALTFGATSILVGAAVSFAGPIGFVGIVVPHVLRALVGPDHRLLLPASVLGGAAFVLVADTAARLLLWPAQLPVGVLTALVGGPFFLSLLLGRGRRLWG